MLVGTHNQKNGSSRTNPNAPQPASSGRATQFPGTLTPSLLRIHNSRPNPRPAIPTRGQPRSHPHNQGGSNLFNVERRLALILKELNCLKDTNSANMDKEDHDGLRTKDNPSADNVEEDDNVEDSGFFIHKEAAYNILSHPHDNLDLIYDLGATKSTVCNPNLLSNLHPCNQTMNTYGGQIQVSHTGTLNLGPVSISPVYYAPMGPRNLISASQLKDHGLKVVHQHRVVLIKAADLVVMSFKRNGNLYVANLSHRLPSVDSIADNPVVSDWHVTLGHPSNNYLRKFLELNKIKSSPATH